MQKNDAEQVNISATNSVCNCHCMTRVDNSIEVHGEIRTNSLMSEWSNFVLAVVAVLGYLCRAIVLKVTMPVLVIPDAKKYNFRREVLATNQNSSSRANGGYEFLLPVKNTKRQLATDVTASIDCVLKRAGDGDDYEKLYFGLPRTMIWANAAHSISIAKNETMYVCFAKLSTSVQSENIGGADVEPSLTCYIQAFGCGEQDLILVSQAISVSILARITVRAKNSNSACIKWVSLHWEGGTDIAEVSDANFKIRLAYSDEEKQATEKYNDLAKDGEGCQ